MAYTQPKGQGSPAAKTGAGIPSALTMTGSPAKHNVQKIKQLIQEELKETPMELLH